MRKGPDLKNQFWTWAEDAQGNDIRVGLTMEETDELYQLEEKDWRARTESTAPRPTEKERARYTELLDKHERARQKRLDILAERGPPKPLH